MRFIYTIFATMLLCNVCIAQSGGFDCPPEGSSPNEMSKHVNLLKNRDIVQGKINPRITSDSILKGGPEDTGRYSSSDYASVTGYVLAADDGGPESCNCMSNDTAKQTVKIYIGMSITSWKDSVFMVEVTPKFKRLHPEIYLAGLIGRKITVSGNMMYNFEAKKFALNANKKSQITDRKTAWEICPVTEIKIVPAN